MSDHAPIPFGLRSKDQKFVDVSNVDRGNKCGCECPSCGTPLIARKGKIREWHFAHASKGVSESKKVECEYSFWVSIRSMAKQIISTISAISLPALTMFSMDGNEVKITEQRIAEVGEVELEKRVAQVYADAVLHVDRYAIAVIFTTPGRMAEAYMPSGDQTMKTGVLEISLEDASEWLFETKIYGEYTERISSFIINDVKIKKWLYHPRVKIIENETEQELFREKPVKAQFITRSSYEVKSRNGRIRLADGKHYKCRNCDFRWQGTNFCSYCNTHRHSIEVEST